MQSSNPLAEILDTGLIAILRSSNSAELVQAAEALLAGGVKAIEVTLTTPGALKVIEQARDGLRGNFLFGAGSVLDPESARAAILAGASFIVSPSLNLKVIEMCQRYSIPVFPGAFTPTEIVAAWEAGADLVKIFPASLGGPGLIRALKAPLPQVRMVPVGGVELENTADFMRAGASAIGVGSSLVNDQILRQRAFSEITLRASRFIEEIQKGRG